MFNTGDYYRSPRRSPRVFTTGDRSPRLCKWTWPHDSLQCKMSAMAYTAILHACVFINDYG